MSVADTSTELAQGFMDQLRLPMLTIPTKQGVSVDLTSPLAELIRTEYGEDPTHFRPEVREFNQLRDQAVRPSRDSHGTSVMRRYYAQLSLLPARFAATRSNIQVTFIWGDAFSEKETAENLVQFEMAAVLFNLGALHSRLGSGIQDELRGACTHFQCSAGAFYLLQTATNFTPTPNQTDMCPEVLAFCKNLMLAQAQECMVEKSLLERKRPSLVSKVAWEVSTLYQKAIDILDLQVGAQLTKKNKTWQKFLQTKFHIYQSVAYFCQAVSLEEDSKYGEAIAFFQVAMECIQAGNKAVKSQLPPVRTAVKYLTDLIQSKSVSAAQTNHQVYHQLVPSFPDLEPIQGALLVKPIEFSISDKSVLGNDIFSKLVPMSVLEANSMYSEEKANLMRSVCSTIQDRNRDLAEYLSKMNIEEVLNYKDNKVSIPADVSKIRSEASNEHQGRVEGMDALLQSVLQMSNQIHRKLDEICMYLTRDAPEVANQIQEFQKQADKIDEFLAQGDKSNQELHQVMKELKPKLKLLTVPESSFLESLPKLDLVSLSFDEQSETRLAMLVGKIEEMQTQRSTLEKKLRSEMDTDDISIQLISCPESSRDQLFEGAMKRHKQTSLLIRQNCDAQDNIVKAMTDTNANLASLRKELIGVRSEREGIYKGLVEAWKRLGSTEDSLKDGMKFYQNLDKKTSKLFDTIKTSLPPPPLQQPIKSELSRPPTLPPNSATQSDNSYKPISPFQSLPSDTSRPPVPSRRLKPNGPEDSNDTENTSEATLPSLDPSKVATFPASINLTESKISTAESKISAVGSDTGDDDELALLNWVEVKPELEQHQIIKPVPQTPIKDNSQSLTLTDLNMLMSANQNVPPAPTVPSVPMQHIPQAPPVVTQSVDTSHLTQLMQSGQSELGASMIVLQTECRAISQSVMELAQNVSAVANQSNQSNAAISSLSQVTSNQSSSLEQLSSHIQTANQNVVYTSQLIKQVEVNLLAKLESVEKSCQDSATRMDQLFQHVTQKQQDVVLKIEPLIAKISQSQSTNSEQIQSLNSSLEEMREDLRIIRSKQETMVLLPSQSESRDPLSLQSRPTQAPSQVDQLWDLLDSKSADQKKSGPVQPSENTAFSPVTAGADRNVNRPASAFQLSSLDNQLSANQILSQYQAQTPASTSQPRPGQNIPQNSRGPSAAVSQSNQFIPSLLPTTVALPPQSMVQTQLPQPTLLHSQKSLPLVSSTQIHEHIPQAIPSIQPSQQLTTQHLARYPPQSQPPLMQAPTIQSNQSLPIQAFNQPNASIPMPSTQQMIPMQQHGLQTSMHAPVQPAVQSNHQIPTHPAVHPNPQIPTHPAVHPSHIPVVPSPPLNPQQQAYIQMLQKQLSSGATSNLTPEQLAAIQTQLLRLS